MIVKCPTCGKPVEWSDKFPFRPFCSERCKLIDLGEWASDSYVIRNSTMQNSANEADQLAQKLFSSIPEEKKNNKN